MLVSRPARSCLWRFAFYLFRLLDLSMAVFSAELPLNKHANSKTSLTKLTKKTPNPLVYTALRRKQHSESLSEPVLFHKHINVVQILPCPQDCISTSTPFIQIQHQKWSSLLHGGLSSHTVIDLSSTNPCGQTHLMGNGGVKKREIEGYRRREDRDRCSSCSTTPRLAGTYLLGHYSDLDSNSWRGILLHCLCGRGLWVPEDAVYVDL